MFLPVLLIVALYLVSYTLAEGLDGQALRPRQQAPRFKAKAVLNDKFIDVSLNDMIEKNQWTGTACSHLNHRCGLSYFCIL
ncbi:hypothetical protein EON65_25600 [archaeon]|nr:MAG: hypothetical protein EON65_25600 [archaeon]